MPKPLTKIAEAKLALEGAHGLLNAARSDLNSPERLEHHLAELEQKRLEIEKQIESARNRLDNRQARYDAAIQLVEERQQDLKRVKHAAKLKKMAELKSKLEAAES